MARNMGFDFGLDKADSCFKRKHRWLFKIPDVSAEGVGALPPSKGARPSLTFKEIECQHMSETIFYPGKPEWKPITLTLYEVISQQGIEHPVFTWIKELYDPEEGIIRGACERTGQKQYGFKKDKAFLEMYDGCGETIETWVFECIWVQGVDGTGSCFGTAVDVYD